MRISDWSSDVCSSDVSYALFRAAQDFAGVVTAAKHEGVGHARHWRMGIAFPAAVAGGGHAHQPGVEPVLEIALQYALVDQHVALRRRALVLEGQRSAPSLHGAVAPLPHPRRGPPPPGPH